jgi:RNA polymerase sigma-70 factor (ECF subfamily)
MRVHAQMGSYDVARPLRPWLVGFVARVAADYRRLARHRREALGADHDDEDARPTAEDVLTLVQLNAEVMDVLGSLSTGKRAVVVLHAIEQQPMPVVASALRIPLATAYSRLRHARLEIVGSASTTRVEWVISPHPTKLFDG